MRPSPLIAALIATTALVCACAPPLRAGEVATTLTSYATLNTSPRTLLIVPRGSAEASAFSHALCDWIGAQPLLRARFTSVLLVLEGDDSLSDVSSRMSALRPKVSKEQASALEDAEKAIQALTEHRLDVYTCVQAPEPTEAAEAEALRALRTTDVLSIEYANIVSIGAGFQYLRLTAPSIAASNEADAAADSATMSAEPSVPPSSDTDTTAGSAAVPPKRGYYVLPRQRLEVSLRQFAAEALVPAKWVLHERATLTAINGATCEDKNATFCIHQSADAHLGLTFPANALVGENEIDVGDPSVWRATENGVQQSELIAFSSLRSEGPTHSVTVHFRRSGLFDIRIPVRHRFAKVAREIALKVRVLPDAALIGDSKDFEIEIPCRAGLGWSGCTWPPSAKLNRQILGRAQRWRMLEAAGVVELRKKLVKALTEARLARGNIADGEWTQLVDDTVDEDAARSLAENGALDCGALISGLQARLGKMHDRTLVAGERDLWTNHCEHVVRTAYTSTLGQRVPATAIHFFANRGESLFSTLQERGVVDISLPAKRGLSIERTEPTSTRTETLNAAISTAQSTSRLATLKLVQHPPLPAVASTLFGTFLTHGKGTKNDVGAALAFDYRLPFEVGFFSFALGYDTASNGSSIGLGLSPWCVLAHRSSPLRDFCSHFTPYAGYDWEAEDGRRWRGGWHFHGFSHGPFRFGVARFLVSEDARLEVSVGFGLYAPSRF